MDNRITILNELKELSPVLANIGREAPYTVPAGYFDSLAGNMLLKISEEKSENGALPNISKTPVYEVPAGYFDSLAGNILNRVKAAAATSPAEELAFLSPVLSRLEKKSPFSTPEGYFTDLSDNVVSGVQAIEFVNEELENLSPLMVSLREMSIYQVPPRYFDQLPAEMLNKVKKQPARVVSMTFTKRVVRYAAAAAVIGIIAMVGYLFINRTGSPNDPNAIPGVSHPEVAKVSDQELESFLADNTVALADAGTVVTNDGISESDTKDLFANVS
ncbi:MAG TPA: hypothetical protein VLD19_14490, partial [Chitinophagaceae bacterium]|nr:hypothetical protein [Chitinophagaceae bacterium]